MRPVRFVALSEDGQALVLADEVGRLLALPIDERIAGVMHPEPGSPPLAVAPSTVDPIPSLSPRDIQARIRSGESAEDVARIAGVPVDRVLRYAGPVLQERAMLAQHARRTRLKGAEKPTPLAEVVNGRLSQHGIDTEKISWDAYRRDDGTWRIIATWPSGKATAQAIWDIDKTRQWSPRTTTWRSICAPSGPRRSSARSPHRSGAGMPCRVRRAVSRAEVGTGCRRRPSTRVPAGIRSALAVTRCSPHWTARSAARRAVVWNRVPRLLLPARTRPGSGRSAGVPPRCSAAARGRPSTTTRTRPRRCRPCRRWRCCGLAGRALRRPLAASPPTPTASRASGCRAGTTCSSAAARPHANPPDASR